MRSRSVLGLPAALLALVACVPPPAAPAPPPAVTAAPCLAASAPVASSASAQTAAPDGAPMGQLNFAITGSPECQRDFREGMLALDSFLYDQAHVSFGAALAADPHCAMAAWGDAMAYDKALWYQRDTAKGRAALARVSSDDERGVTSRERAFLAAARALFAKDSIDDGHTAWLAAAAAMDRDYPNDDDVMLQHALALLSLHAEDAAHVREQMEAGALALQVFARKPGHPGAAHFVIHAFDTRAHAILALPAAETYARIAPAASHALHMPSHTFTHLGMWRDVVPSNERAYAASIVWEKSRGHTPSEYDWHSYSWLVAAHLELGQYTAARKLTDEAGALLAASKDDSSELRAGYTSMVGNYVTQTGKWGELEPMIAPVLAPAFDEGATQGGQAEPKAHVACADHAPGGKGESRLPTVLFARMTANALRAEAAIRLGDEASVVKRVADIKAVRAQMASWGKMLPPDLVARWDAIGDALVARAHAGAKPSAATQKKTIEALERRLHLETGRSTSGPAMARTTHEILGDALLTAGRTKEARTQFEQDLDERPNRAIALLGAARAAKADGDAATARERYAALAELWKDADADVPALAEAREGAK